MSKGGKGPKGGGKGAGQGAPKGVFTGKCFNCGQEGHSAKYCPKGKGKGGKGGRLNELQNEWEQGKGGAQEQECRQDFLDLQTLVQQAEDKSGFIEVKSRKRSKKQESVRRMNRLVGGATQAQELLDELNGEMSLDELHEFNGEKWEKVSMTVDSGAMENVTPTGTVRNVRSNINDETKNQVYRTASGNKLYNQGEKRVFWETDAGEKGRITLQVTGVQRALASVGKMCAGGNRVVFEPDGGYIENIKTGARTQLKKEGMIYKLDLWVKAEKKEDELMAVESATPSSGSGENPFKWQGWP